MGGGNFESGPLARYGASVARNPCKAFAGNCAVIWFFIFVFVVLVQRLGEDFFNYQVEAPLYLVDNKYRERDDAVSLVIEDAPEIEDTGPALQLERVEMSNRRYSQIGISVIYTVENGKGIYDASNLQAIYAFEKKLRESALYKSSCQLAWTEEQKLNQDFAGITALNEDEENFPHCRPPVSQLSSAYPLGLLKCSKGTGHCTSADEILETSFVTENLKRTSERQNMNSDKESWSVLMQVLSVNFPSPDSSSNFDADINQVEALRSVFPLGVPLRGYATASTNVTQQMKDLENLILTSYLAFFDAERAELEKSGIKLWYDITGLRGAYLQRQVPKDASKAVGSFIFVFVFMTLMKKSLWISVTGMGMILLSFVPAYFLYWAILQQTYFGVFNLLSIFIILGVGADDIFVFSDTWSHSGHEEQVSSSVVKRMQWTLRRAGSAMLVTSLTTMVSFFATARSNFPGISTFGLWAGALVIANYIGVITYFPSAMSMYHHYVRNLCKASSSGQVAPQASTEKANGEGIAPPHKEKPNSIVNYFENVHGPFVERHRKVIIFLFLVFVAVFGGMAAKLEVDSEAPQMFSKGHNLEEYRSELEKHFKSSSISNPLALRFSIIHGLERHPIDRNGTDPSIPAQKGKPVYEKDFELHRVADCVLALCEELAKGHEDLGLADPAGKITCWAKDFRDMVGQTTWENIVKPENKVLWNQHFGEFLSSRGRKYLAGSVVLGEGQKPVLSQIQIESSVNFGIPYEEGIRFLDKWESKIDSWYQNDLPQCKVASQEVAVIVGCRLGQNFYMAEQLVKEAFAGITMSLLLAFVVLTVFSGNIIVSLTATFCISCIVLCVIGYIVLSGAKLGMLESINLTMTPGLSVDFVAHLAEGYITETKGATRSARMKGSIRHVGVSIVSGAFSTTGACVFLFFPEIRFFVMFGSFIFVTIALSIAFSLFFFTALMFQFGPEHSFGSISSCTKKSAKS